MTSHMTFESFWDLSRSSTSIVRVNPVKESSFNQESTDEKSAYEAPCSESDPAVIDVDFEDVRSFPVKYTLTVYNNRGEVVVHECAPSFVNLKA